MRWATESLSLSSDKIVVRSLQTSDFDRIAEAIHDPDGWSGRVWNINTPEKIREMLRLQLATRERGECSPFVYLVGNEVAGISRYLHISPEGKRLEIGGTCIAPKWRRTFVNTEVKNLLLTHAFETLGAVRVELRVDCLNYTSQLNVLRLGATFEGKIRHWQARNDGSLPDGMLYSITSRDWPAVKERLRLLRQQKTLLPPFLPLELAAPRLTIRLHRLSDAQELLELVQRNHKSLIDSFPQSANLQTVHDVEAYIAERAHWAALGTAFYYGAWDRETNRLIAQLHVKKINWKARSGELGYYVDSDFRRKGVCSELVKLVLVELFEKQNFRRISLRVIMGNEPSIFLARKLGFEQEGVLRSEFVTGQGDWVDVALFAKTKSDQGSAAEKIALG